MKYIPILLFLFAGFAGIHMQILDAVNVLEEAEEVAEVGEKFLIPTINSNSTVKEEKDSVTESIIVTTKSARINDTEAKITNATEQDNSTTSAPEETEPSLSTSTAQNNLTSLSTTTTTGKTTIIIVTQTKPAEEVTEEIPEITEEPSTIPTTIRITFPPVTTTKLPTTVEFRPGKYQEEKSPTWAIGLTSVFVTFAIIFTILYFLRKFIQRRRREDQRRLLTSQEGFFIGGGSTYSDENLNNL